MALSRNIGFELELCKVLGLEPTRTRSIDIHVGVGEVTVCTVQRWVENGELKEITRLLECCVWREQPNLVDVTGLGEEWERKALVTN